MSEGAPMLLVTDVTGHVGAAVLAELAQAAVPVRALLAPADPAPVVQATNIATNIDWVRVDIDDAAALERAMQGVQGMFLAARLGPRLAAEHAALARAAQAAGVQRVVQLSGVGANSEMCCARALRWLGDAEQAIAATAPFELTRLQPTHLLQMLFDFAPNIQRESAIVGPFRNSAWSWVDARDVAAVAVAILRNGGHGGQTYTVTGAQFLDFQQLATRLGEQLGRPVRYQDITANEARGRLQCMGLAPVMIEAKLELWDACVSNLLAVAPNDVVRSITGRAPRSLEDFLQEHRQRFLAPVAA